MSKKNTTKQATETETVYYTEKEMNQGILDIVNGIYNHPELDKCKTDAEKYEVIRLLLRGWKILLEKELLK